MKNVPMTEDEKWQSDMRFKQLDLGLKLLSALLVGGGMIAALIMNNRTLQQQQKLFEATSERDWSRRLFDEKMSIYGRIASAAYRLKESENQQQASACVAQLEELEGEAVLVAPASLIREIKKACGAARRYIDSGQRDDRPHEDGKESPDLTASCVRLITECRERVLHANGIDLSPQDRAEDAVSTAYGSLEGASP
jgi:hypothetical protein